MAESKTFYVPSPEYVTECEPFKNDLFERKLLADRLTTYIDGLRSGCVIGIHAPWGEGKTYFGRNWKALLSSQGYKTIYLDAFEQDYREDPFLVIAAEINLCLKKDEGESWIKFSEACTKAGKALLPVTAKLGVNFLGRMILGTSDLSEEFEKNFEKKVGEAAEKYVKSRLEDYEEEKKTITHFKKALSQFAADQGEKPVVFFIDELDRCRPTFAVQMIERIKHFFDTPNIVFVLLINREQLEEAVNGVYGDGLDAHTYLGKFIHFFLALPKHLPIQGSRNFNHTYCVELTKRYGYSMTDSLLATVETIAVFSSIWRLSLRDLEKVFIYYTIGQPINHSPRLAGYLVCLKVHDVGTFHKIALDDRAAHVSLLHELQELQTGGMRTQMINGAVLFHRLILDPATEVSSEEAVHLSYFVDTYSYKDLGHFIKHLIGRIDTILVD